MLGPFRADPADTVLLLDFDGTLAPIVDEPAAARPEPGAPELLDELSRLYRTVAVISGRPVSFVDPFLPHTVGLVGHYGLERRVAGRTVTVGDADRWRGAVAQAIRVADRDGPAGLHIEDKGLSVTLHVRLVPEAADALGELADRIAGETGLVTKSGKMSVELAPPIAIDKGVAVDDLVAGAGAAVFIGDDLGDLPAFAALDRFAGNGGRALRVAVSGPEAPDELIAAADLVLADQSEVLPLLRLLLDTSS